MELQGPSTSAKCSAGSSHSKNPEQTGGSELTELQKKLEAKHALVQTLLKHMQTFVSAETASSRHRSSRRAGLRRIASLESVRRTSSSQADGDVEGTQRQCPETELSATLLFGAKKLAWSDYSGELPTAMETCAEAFHRIAELKSSLARDVQSKCVDPLERCTRHGAGAMQAQRKRLSARQRDFDRKGSAQRKRSGTPGAGDVPVEVAVACEKLEECIRESKAEAEHLVESGEEVRDISLK